MNNNSFRPRVTVSVAITLDGYMDSTDQPALRISSERDLQEVHRLRARSGAILVGAETLRSDDCQLTVRYDQGGSTKPMRITLTRSGCLDFGAKFFALDGVKKMIFCTKCVEPELRKNLPAQTYLYACDGDSCFLPYVLETIKASDVDELLVEGGASVISQLLSEQLVDRMRVAISPQILGSAGKSRLFETAPATDQSSTEWRTDSVEKFGETVVIWYEIKNDSKD